jgi:hypothetical protein
MMEEKWERVGEETSLQHMHLKKKKNKKEKWALRAYLFSSPMVVEYNYGSLQSPFKLSQMVARTSKNPLKSQNPLSKEMDEMRNRMREIGMKECFDLLANPRLPFLLTSVGSGSIFCPLGALKERSLLGLLPQKPRSAVFHEGARSLKTLPFRVRFWSEWA